MIVWIYSGPRSHVEKEIARSLGVKENEAKGWKGVVKYQPHKQLKASKPF